MPAHASKLAVAFTLRCVRLHCSPSNHLRQLVRAYTCSDTTFRHLRNVSTPSRDMTSQGGLHKKGCGALLIAGLVAIGLLLLAPGAGATSRILLDTPAPAVNASNTTNTTTIEVAVPVARDVVIVPDVVVRKVDKVPNMALAWAPGVMDHPNMMPRPMFEGFFPVLRDGEVLVRTGARATETRHNSEGLFGK